MKYVFLAIAIVSEVIATNAMNASQQFTKPIPSTITILGYAAAFYFLSLTLKTMPIGTAYAIWSGVGIILTAIVAMVLFKQIPDLPAIIGMAFIIVGVLIINVFSRTSAH